MLPDKRARRVGLTLIIGGLGVLLARHLQLPGGPIVGAIVLTGAANLLGAPLDEPPGWLRSAGRVVLGLTIGATVTSDTLQAIGRAQLPVTVMIVMMISLGFLVAWVIHHLVHMPLATALCGSSPGGLTTLVVMATDLGGEAPVVASMHMVRLVSVTLFMPAFVQAAFPDGGAIAQAMTTEATGSAAVWQLLVLLAVGFALGQIAQRLKIPGGDMIVGMAVAAVANTAWLHVPGLPATWKLFAQWVVGAGVGATVTRQALRAFKPYALAGSLMTALLILAGLFAGWLLARLTSLDLITALMGSSPGGADTMMILAGELGADVRLVTAMHVSRLIIITLLTPVAIRLMGRRTAHRARAAAASLAGLSGS